MTEGDLTGAVLDGRYRVLEAVAEGAMGVVYRAERVKLGRIVAVKVLHDELPNELSSRKRFEIEAQAMAKLEHPHCAAVIDVGLHGDRPFVVMDFVSGPNLKEVISNEGPMEPQRAVEIVRQTLSGLAHAHEHGIIHRDIKPANIVLSQKAGLGDHVKILDFGLARVAQDKSNLTTGIVVGTPSYMAPEQIRGVVIDGRADLYACGILLFELLTGKKPFHSPKDDPIEVCSMHLKQKPPRMADLRPGVDFGALEDVVARALAKNPSDRYDNAVAMAGALVEAAGRGTSKIFTPVAGIPAQDPPPVAESPAASVKSTIAAVMPPPPRAVQPPVELARPPEAMASATIPSAYAPTEPDGRVISERAMPVSPRTLAMIGGGVLLLIIVIAVAAGGGGGGPSQPSFATADAGVRVDAESPAPAEPSPADNIVERATALIAEGRREAARELLVSSRHVFPDDARLPFMAGKLHMASMFWSDGLKLFRDAIRIDPSYRSNPELVKEVLKGFITTPSRNYELAQFLRETIGPEIARPYLEQTASDHPNATVRARAAAELKRYP